MAEIRVVLPQHLQTLARVADREVAVAVEGAVTVRAILDAIEARFPQLRGTICDHGSSTPGSSGLGRVGRRSARPGSAGRSCASSPARRTGRTRRSDDPLPAAVAAGREPFLVVGAMAGG